MVRFPNEACTTSNNDMGVCYTANECESRGGTNSGTCASGFGVCCSFSVSCGQMSSQNNTYFSSDGSESSPCTAKVIKRLMLHLFNTKRLGEGRKSKERVLLKDTIDKLPRK